MKLCEHPEFGQAILNAEEHFRAKGLRAAIIEKDYYVTEALRAISQHSGSKVIFKGGTSLSKGWDLIQRFSEDIDLFLDPDEWQPRLSDKKATLEMKKLRDHVSKVAGLRHDPQSSHSSSIGRSEIYVYARQFGGAGEVANRILLEVGTASGREPTEERPIESLLAQSMRAVGVSIGAEDEAAFSMRLLHYRRTFVEKLFAIHAKVELYLENPARGLGTHSRHYYDLACLAERPEVRKMLESSEYGAICRDYDRISRKHYPRDYRPPPNLRFSASMALYPAEDLADYLGQQYERQCAVLCFDAYPSWPEVMQRFQNIKDLI